MVTNNIENVHAVDQRGQRPVPYEEARHHKGLPVIHIVRFRRYRPIGDVQHGFSVTNQYRQRETNNQRSMYYYITLKFQIQFFFSSVYGERWQSPSHRLPVVSYTFCSRWDGGCGVTLYLLEVGRFQLVVLPNFACRWTGGRLWCLIRSAAGGPAAACGLCSPYCRFSLFLSLFCFAPGAQLKTSLPAEKLPSRNSAII